MGSFGKLWASKKFGRVIGMIWKSSDVSLAKFQACDFYVDSFYNNVS